MSTQLDPWIDADFPSNVDFSQHPEDLADGIIQEDQILQPEVVQNTRPALEDQPPAPVAVEPEEPETPESFDLKGGGQGVIEHTKKGWRVSIDVGVGGIQNFYGKTKNEAMMNMANSIASGTKKIRELNRQVKLGPTVEVPAAAVPTVVAGRKLTDDEVFDFKTKLQSNPDLAIEEWFTKRFGRSPETVVENSDKGGKAARELEIEAANKGFLQRCPDYFPDEAYENYRSLIGWLAKNRLSRSLTAANGEQIISELFNRGQYTAENLEEAYTDLNDSGLLLQAPRVQTPPAQETVPAPTTGRIVRQETRPRAGLGIRSSEISSSAPPPTIKPLSADDLENLSTEEIDKRIAQITREIRSRR